MGSGATLDRKIYSFFKKGVFDGDLEVLGNYIVTRILESAVEEYALKVSATVEDSIGDVCKFGVFGNMLLTTGALVAEVWGGYSKTRLSAGQATGQVGAHYFEFIVDSGVANCPSAQVIQLASWINGALNAVHGFITFRDYGSNPMTNLFNIMDITSETGKLWYGNTLKIRIGGAAKYLVLADTENPVVIGAVSGLGLSMHPPAAGAGLKIHTHVATGAVYDYACEFKGESVKTSGFYDGLALDYKLYGSGTSIMRAIRATVELGSGYTMNGALATQSWLVGGLFSAGVSGTLNGAGVCVVGAYGEIGSCGGSTLTAAKYIASLWGNSVRGVALSSGLSALLLLTQWGAATVDYGIRIENTGTLTTGISLSGTMTTGIDISGTTTFAISSAAGKARFGSAQGAGVILDGAVGFTENQALQVHASITAANKPASAYAGIYGTMSLSANQNQDLSAFAIWGELWLNSVNLAGASNFASVWGNVIMSGTVTSSSGWIAGVWAVLNGPATAFTNTGLMAGFAADCELLTNTTNSGTIAAFYATKGADSNKMAWPMGIYLPSGACKAGLVMGAKSSNSAIGHHIGVANSADNAGDKAIAVFCDDNNAVLATDAQGINSRCLILAAQTGDKAMDALRGHLRIVASITPSAQKGFAATSGYVEASGTYTFGDATNIVFISALSGTVELGGTPTLSDNVRLCGILLSGNFASTYNSDTKPAVGVMYQGQTNGFQFALGFQDGVSGMVSLSSHTTNETHKIAVWINGVGTRYIHVCSD